MDLYDLRTFFMWCSIINLVLFVIGYLVVAYAADWVFRVHTRWFPMTREAFTVAIYSSFGQYKLLIVVFNIIPFIALVMMT